MMLADSHAHIHFKHFNPDRPAVIQRARQKLEFLVEVGVNSLTNQRALDLAAEHPGFIIPILGLHPTDASPGEFDSVRQQIIDNNPVAIGEVGLDFYHEKDEAKRQSQRDTLEKILGLAEELKKPVALHTRDAEQECFEIVQSYKLPQVIFHCYGGPIELARKIIECYWISMPCIITYVKEKQDLVAELGIGRVLLETDCPFLSPIQRQRNEPAFVELSAKKISSLLGVPLEEVAEKTTRNTKDAYCLSEKGGAPQVAENGTAAGINTGTKNKIAAETATK